MTTFEQHLQSEISNDGIDDEDLLQLCDAQDPTQRPERILLRKCQESGQIRCDKVRRIVEHWQNPVFLRSETRTFTLSDVNLGTKQLLLQNSKTNFTNVRLDTQSLAAAEIVAQVDHKYILVIASPPRTGLASPRQRLLVLVDQHAADERIQVERLFQELNRPPQGICKGVLKRSAVATLLLDKPVMVKLNSPQDDGLRVLQDKFQRWGVVYDVMDTLQGPTAFVHCLPSVIMERCRLVPEVLGKMLLEEAGLLQEGLGHGGTGATRSRRDEHEVRDWVRCIHDCPRSMIDLINSRACRSAIMFNDRLTKLQCEGLIAELAHCVLPFQCAHGRPTLAVLANME